MTPIFGKVEPFFFGSCGFGAAPSYVRTTDKGAGFGNQLHLGYANGPGTGDGRNLGYSFAAGSGTGITLPLWI